MMRFGASLSSRKEASPTQLLADRIVQRALRESGVAPVGDQRDAAIAAQFLARQRLVKPLALVLTQYVHFVSAEDLLSAVHHAVANRHWDVVDALVRHQRGCPYLDVTLEVYRAAIAAQFDPTDSPALQWLVLGATDASLQPRLDAATLLVSSYSHDVAALPRLRAWLECLLAPFSLLQVRMHESCWSPAALFAAIERHGTVELLFDVFQLLRDSPAVRSGDWSDLINSEPNKFRWRQNGHAPPINTRPAHQAPFDSLRALVECNCLAVDHVAAAALSNTVIQMMGNAFAAMVRCEYEESNASSTELSNDKWKRKCESERLERAEATVVALFAEQRWPWRIKFERPVFGDTRRTALWAQSSAAGANLLRTLLARAPAFALSESASLYLSPATVDVLVDAQVGGLESAFAVRLNTRECIATHSLLIAMLRARDCPLATVAQHCTNLEGVRTDDDRHAKSLVVAKALFSHERWSVSLVTCDLIGAWAPFDVSTKGLARALFARHRHELHALVAAVAASTITSVQPDQAFIEFVDSQTTAFSEISPISAMKLFERSVTHGARGLGWLAAKQMIARLAVSPLALSILNPLGFPTQHDTERTARVVLINVAVFWLPRVALLFGELPLLPTLVLIKIVRIIIGKSVRVTDHQLHEAVQMHRASRTE